MKMARAREPESFLWTHDEVELLPRLTLDYNESKLQERLNSTSTSCCYELLQGSELEG